MYRQSAVKRLQPNVMNIRQEILCLRGVARANAVSALFKLLVTDTVKCRISRNFSNLMQGQNAVCLIYDSLFKYFRLTTL